ncbi:hypothetical protein NMG60_11003259 [Bertholletia excelsa]
MASSLPENWGLINGEIGFDKLEVQEIDSALLMSLLEESHAEECDDERLSTVMRSLEAEIDPKMIHGHEFAGDPTSDGCQLSDFKQVDGQDWPVSHDLEFNWMEIDMVPSSPSDDVARWYMGACGDDMQGFIEFDAASQLYHGAPPEEHTYSYGSLWQETHT